MKLSKLDIQYLDALTVGLGYTRTGMAKHLGISNRSVKVRIHRIATMFEIEYERHLPQVRIAYLWTCPLFREGLKEMGRL